MGAFGYIVKPFESNEVMIDVANALRRRRLEIENRLHRENLEDIVTNQNDGASAGTRMARAKRKGTAPLDGRKRFSDSPLPPNTETVLRHSIFSE